MTRYFDPASSEMYDPTKVIAFCPQCGSVLAKVKPDKNSMLNVDQFDSVRAGDWYCIECPSNNRGKGQVCYWWDSEVAYNRKLITVQSLQSENAALRKRVEEREQRYENARNREEEIAHKNEVEHDLLERRLAILRTCLERIKALNDWKLTPFEKSEVYLCGKKEGYREASALAAEGLKEEEEVK